MLAQVGALRTAFQGFGGLPDEPAPETGAGTYFLTDDGVVSGPPTPLIVTYDTPVAAASGMHLVVDGDEAWELRARDASDGILDTFIVGPSNALADGSSLLVPFPAKSNECRIRVFGRLCDPAPPFLLDHIDVPSRSLLAG